MKTVPKHILAILLSCLSLYFLLSLTACGSSGDTHITTLQSNSSAAADSSPLLTDSSSPIRETRADLLGTVVSITLYGDADSEIFEEAFSIVADIDARMSANRDDSEISKIGDASGKSAVLVSADTFALIERAIEISELCGGAFDITIAPVMELWKAEEFFCVLPQASMIASKLPLVDYKNIILSDSSVMLAEEGMKLDLGAIAKGYACDSVMSFLKERGVETALLDFGGNIYAYGEKPDGSPWKLGIRSPIIGETGVICTVSVRDSSVVTSGGYERYFEKDGMIYHHLLDPGTGYPSDNGIVSMTIINESSTTADALSTACFVLGPDKGLQLLEALPGTEGILVTKDRNIKVTSGLKENVSLTDDRFNIDLVILD